MIRKCFPWISTSTLLSGTLLSGTLLLITASSPTLAADSLAGTYRGFLAFDFKGKEIREAMMVSFHDDGTLIMGAEESHDEPVDPESGLATKNDFESANLGLWRNVGSEGLEFGTQQYRAGSAFCGPVNQHGEGLLATCSFVLTGRLKAGQGLRGERPARACVAKAAISVVSEAASPSIPWTARWSTKTPSTSASRSITACKNSPSTASWSSRLLSSRLRLGYLLWACGKRSRGILIL